MWVKSYYRMFFRCLGLFMRMVCAWRTVVPLARFSPTPRWGDPCLGHAVGRLARALRVVVEVAVVGLVQAVGAGDSREAGVVGERGGFVLGPVGVDELGHFPFEGVEGIGGRRYARRAEDDQPEAQARTLHGTLLNVDPAASRHL